MYEGAQLMRKSAWVHNSNHGSSPN
jgi:hypothetical protein